VLPRSGGDPLDPAVKPRTNANLAPPGRNSCPCWVWRVCRRWRGWCWWGR